MVEENKNFVEFIYCSCGCQKTRPKRDKWGHLGEYFRGHGMRGRRQSETHRKHNAEARLGKKLPDEHRKNISLATQGENNPMYGKHHSIETKIKIGRANTKNGFVSYSALHIRVKKKFPKTELCQLCLSKPPRDLACVTNIYDFPKINWKWFCRSCHKKHDFIMNGRKS